MNFMLPSWNPGMDRLLFLLPMEKSLVQHWIEMACVLHDIVLHMMTGLLWLLKAAYFLLIQHLIKEKGRLQPGKMFVVDMEQGRIISDDELKQTICSQKPYGEWLNKYKIRLEELPEPSVHFTHLEHDQIFKYQKAFGYSIEDLDTIIAPMALMVKNLLAPWVPMCRWQF